MTSLHLRRGWAIVTCLVLVLSSACRGQAAPAGRATAPHERSSAQASAPSGEQRARPSQDDGRHDLSVDEQRGGHTLERHVGKTDEDLRDRLRRERRISAASTYTDRDTAERVVAATLAQARSRVERWADRDGRRPNLALDYRGRPGEVIGRSLSRGRDTLQDCTDAVVVLKWDEGQRDYYVLTSYPEVRR